MARAVRSSEKKGTVLIEAKRGKLVLSAHEADQVLADLQVMYHMVALGIEEKEDGEADRRGNQAAES